MNKKRIIIPSAALCLAILILAAAFTAYRYIGSISVQQTKAYMEGFGIMAPVVFTGMCILRGITFLPCGMFSALGGAVFGKLMGTVLTLLGLTAGSILTFYLTRSIGKDWVRRKLGKRYEKYDGYFSRDFPYSIFLMRVLPILPYDAVSCAAGLSGVGFVKFVTETFVGSVPGVFLYVYFGDSIRSMSYKRIGISLLMILILVIVPFLYRHVRRTRVGSS